MKLEIEEWILLNDQEAYSLSYLCETSGLLEDELRELIDHRLLMPIDSAVVDMTFSLQSLELANSARRLRDDFELDRHGMILALTLLKRIDELQQEVK